MQRQDPRVVDLEENNGLMSHADNVDVNVTAGEVARAPGHGQSEAAGVAAPAAARPRAPSREDEDDEEGASLEEAAGMIASVMIPVSITMAIVVVAVRILYVSDSDSGTTSVRSLYYAESSSDSTGTKLLGSLVNAIIFLAIILATTVAFVVLYYFRCIKLIIVWLVGSTVLLLGSIGAYFCAQLLTSLNAPLDYVSFSFLLWNFAVTGVVSIFWVAPQFMTRAYLIVVSCLVATYFTALPEWTAWAILAIVAIYDIFAVLCPNGPLRVLVELAQKRQEPIPALLYNAAAFIMMAEKEDVERKSDSAKSAPRSGPAGASGRVADSSAVGTEAAATAASGEEEHKGIKLGLGDFVFYSVLMGRAALFDVLTVITCFVAILTGLFGTLLLLGIMRKALPALPISIALGFLFYFLSRIFLLPFVITNGADQAFV